MKSGKLLKRCFVTIFSLLSLLGVFCAGKNAQAFEPPSGYTKAYAIQNPIAVQRNSSYSGNVVSCGSTIEPFAYNSTTYISIQNEGGDCSNHPTFNLRAGDLIHVQISGSQGFMSLYQPSSILGGSGRFLGFSLETADYSLDLWFIALDSSSYDSTFDFSMYASSHRNDETNATIHAINIWRPNNDINYSTYLENIRYELWGCSPSAGNSYCTSRPIKRILADIYESTDDISTTTTNISTILDNIRNELWNCHGDSACESKSLKEWVQSVNSDLSDISNTINEENETNKTEKSNIENQTPESSGFNIDNQQTTNMIGVVNTFVSGLQNVSTSGSCLISGDLGNWDGVNINMGNLNLCEHQPPVYVQIGCNLVMIVLVFGLTWWLIHLSLKLWRYTS